MTLDPFIALVWITCLMLAVSPVTWPARIHPDMRVVANIL